MNVNHYLKSFPQKNPTHKLSNLFPAQSPVTHDLRSICDFQTSVSRTDRFLKIPSCIKEFS